MSLALAAAVMFALPQDPPPLNRDLHGDPLPPGAVARLGRLRFGHYASIYGNALSADGKTLATGGGDQSIRIWDIPSGRLRRIIDTRVTFVIALTADGATMASASSHDKCTRIHDTRTGRELATLPGEALSLSFSKDNARIAVAGRRVPLRVYDTATWKVHREFPEESKFQVTADFFDGGKGLASAGSDKTFRTWNAETGAELKKVDVERAAYKVVTSPDSRTVALSYVIGDGPAGLPGETFAVLLFDPNTGREVRKLSGATDMVLTMSYSSDNKTLVAGGKDLVFRQWDLATGAELNQFKGHRDRISGVAFIHGESRFISTSDDHMIRMWDASNGTELPVRGGTTPRVWGLSWSPDGRQVASAGHDGVVRTWEPLTGNELARLVRHNGVARAIAWSPAGDSLASASDDGTIRIWDPGTGKCRREIPGGGVAPNTMAWSPDGKWVAGAGIGSVSSWSADTGKPRFQLTLPELIAVPKVAYSPDGKAVAVTNEQKMWILDASTGEEWLSARGFDMGGVTFLSDRSLAWPGQDYLVILESERLLSVISPEEGARNLKFIRDRDGNPPDLRNWGLRLWFNEHKKEFRYSSSAWNLRGVVVSLDGWMLAVGSSDGSVRIIESFTGLELKKLKWHYGNVDSMAFSPDGNFLASASNGETSALVWDLRATARYQGIDAGKYWAALAGSDAAAAHEAVAAFASGGEPAIKELKARIVLKFDPAVASKEVAELDHELLERREAAQAAVGQYGFHALPALRAFLEKKPSAEARGRVEDLLVAMEGAVIRNPEALQRARAIRALERLAARDLLEKISKESPSLRERGLAAAALKRMSK